MITYDAQDGYRFKITQAAFSFGACVKLQRHLFWCFWETVDSMIPLSDDPIEERVERAKDQLWESELWRIENRNYFK